MAWEARCNQQGYTYYVNTETGVMQWAPPPSPPLTTEAIEIVDDVAPFDSDSSCSEAENIEDDGDGDDDEDEDDDRCETLLNSRDLDETLGLPRLVQTSVYRALTWVVWEVWQSHRELSAYLARATQRLLHGLSPAFLRPSRAMLVHPHAIPTSFIPASSPKSAVVSDDVASSDDMA